MNKYILRRDSLSLPIYIEAESFEDAIEKTFTNYTYKEVQYPDLYDLKVIDICTKEQKYFEIHLS